MIKIKITYLTQGGEKKTRSYPYANPNSDNVTLKDFANALFALSDNSISDIYKIDTMVLLDDSDDIVTPIVETTAEP